MAKKNTQKTNNVEEPVKPAEEIVQIEAAEVETTVETADAPESTTEDDGFEPIRIQETPVVATKVVRDGETEPEDYDALLDTACAAASAVMNTLDWDSTSALTDGQIQSLIDPFLTFAGSVPVETAGPIDADDSDQPGE